MHPAEPPRATDAGPGGPLSGLNGLFQVQHGGNGDSRRRGARRDAGVGSFDAENNFASPRTSTATLGSPETTEEAMAHGGVLPENTTAANSNQIDVPGCNREGERVG